LRPRVPTPSSSIAGPAASRVWTVALGAFVLSATRSWRFVHDDAFIVLRYAHNLLAGHGPVWNPGERVEGYTSPLWLLQVAALGACGLPLRYAAQILGLGWLLFWIGLHVHGLSGRARWTAVLVATCGPIGIWSLGGLETAGFGALLAASFLAHARWSGRCAPAPRSPGPWPMAASLGLLVLTRPEGLLFLGSVLVERLRARDRRGLAALAAGACGPAALALLFRRLYYAAWLPNSALVKLPHAGEGWRAFPGYALENLALWFPLLLLVPLLTPSRRLLARAAPWLVSAALYAVYLACVGGDHMPGARLLVPLLAVATTLCGLALEEEEVDADLGRRTRPLLVAACALAQMAVVLLRPPVYEDGAARTGTYVGVLLERLLPAGSLVALNSAGATPFYAPDLAFLDMLGINDARIAREPAPPALLPWQAVPGHRMGDGRYVLSRRPDVVILGPAHGDTRPWFYGDLQILQDTTFPRDYAQVSMAIRFADLRPDAVEAIPPWDGIPGEEGERLTLFVRRGSRAEAALAAPAAARPRR
jgi:arabinofuranosyltransferase